MHEDNGLMESFDVPPTIHLNILHFAVLCRLVSKHCSVKDCLPVGTTCWLWARGFFVSLSQLCKKVGPITTAKGPAIATMGRLRQGLPQAIKSEFGKYFGGNDLREVGEEDTSTIFHDGYLVNIIMSEFDQAYQVALDQLTVRQIFVAIWRVFTSFIRKMPEMPSAKLLLRSVQLLLRRVRLQRRSV
ncbi:hypothetical protein BDZ89DRAFT_183669 [Hymenopellis radicata]|nr:hypothetical protein BDZ89DRAFT_183669 [Hymenopellis radicata]